MDAESYSINRIVSVKQKPRRIGWSNSSGVLKLFRAMIK